MDFFILQRVTLVSRAQVNDECYVLRLCIYRVYLQRDTGERQGFRTSTFAETTETKKKEKPSRKETTTSATLPRSETARVRFDVDDDVDDGGDTHVQRSYHVRAPNGTAGRAHTSADGSPRGPMAVGPRPRATDGR